MIAFFKGLFGKLRAAAAPSPRETLLAVVGSLRRASPMTYEELGALRTRLEPCVSDPAMLRARFALLKEALRAAEELRASAAGEDGVGPVAARYRLFIAEEFKRLAHTHTRRNRDVSYYVKGQVVFGEVPSSEEESYFRAENIEQLNTEAPRARRCDLDCVLNECPACLEARLRREIAKTTRSGEPRLGEVAKRRRLPAAPSATTVTQLNERLGCPALLGRAIADDAFCEDDLDSDDRARYLEWRSTVERQSAQLQALRESGAVVDLRHGDGPRLDVSGGAVHVQPPALRVAGQPPMHANTDNPFAPLLNNSAQMTAVAPAAPERNAAANPFAVLLAEAKAAAATNNTDADRSKTRPDLSKADAWSTTPAPVALAQAGSAAEAITEPGNVASTAGEGFMAAQSSFVNPFASALKQPDFKMFSAGQSSAPFGTGMPAAQEVKDAAADGKGTQNIETGVEAVDIADNTGNGLLKKENEGTTCVAADEPKKEEAAAETAVAEPAPFKNPFAVPAPAEDAAPAEEPARAEESTPAEDAPQPAPFRNPFAVPEAQATSVPPAPSSNPFAAFAATGSALPFSKLQSGGTQAPPAPAFALNPTELSEQALPAQGPANPFTAASSCIGKRRIADFTAGAEQSGAEPGTAAASAVNPFAAASSLGPPTAVNPFAPPPCVLPGASTSGASTEAPPLPIIPFSNLTGATDPSTAPPGPVFPPAQATGSAAQAPINPAILSATNIFQRARNEQAPEEPSLFSSDDASSRDGQRRARRRR